MTENEVFDKYKVGNFIYPAVVAKFLNISMIDAYKICEKRLKEVGDIENTYQLRCPRCHHIVCGTTCSSLRKIPIESDDVIECDTCDNEIKNDFDNYIVFYKKIKGVN